MRLDKYICASTELTRQTAKKAISNGWVTINGEVAKSGAVKIAENDKVTLEDKPISLIGLRYIMLNKPQDFVCSTQDEVHPSVLNLIEVVKQKDLHIAGRLDVDTTGLVLITDDGKWSHAITSPKKDCGKRYRVELADPVDEQTVELFEQGIELRNERQPTLPAKLEIIEPYEVLLTLREGKYHQVKRMFAAIGNKVVTLHREAIGQIELDEALAPGEWRNLTEQELATL